MEEPSSLRATKVSHYQLTKLSKALGSNWRKLGNSLGVSEQQLEYISKWNKRENDKGKGMLDEWKRTSGDAAPLEAVQEALKKAEMDDLLDIVAGTHSYDHRKVSKQLGMGLGTQYHESNSTILHICSCSLSNFER